MPISIRRVEAHDIMQLQNANLHCLAENYQLWYWMYHYLLCPNISHIATNSHGKCLSYVLGKMVDENRKERVPPPPNGHITSVATYTNCRRLGIATKLMLFTQRSFHDCFRAHYVSLHQRETNRAATALYQNRLGYKHQKTEYKYYADGENGLELRLTFEDRIKKS